jgi:predicted Zn-ribbon and HTH transcriptional regulator
MKLIHAYLCPDCEEIFDAFNVKQPVRCPSCTNSEVIPLTKFIPSLEGIKQEQEVSNEKGN